MSNETVTELGRFEFGKNGRVVLSRSARPITYYTRSWWTCTWVACVVSGGEGCAAMEHAELSLVQAPPPLRSPPTAALALAPASAPVANQSVKKPLTQAESDALRLMKALQVAESVRTWWNKPFPPLLPPKPALVSAPVSAPAASKSSTALVIPPFDIQQIPGAMEKLKLPVSAQMMRHWFEGEANYSVTEAGMKVGIDQNGKPYPASMIDQSIIELDWVLGFARARKAYDELLSTGIYKPNAAAIAKQKLLAYMACIAKPFAPLNGLTASARDIHRLHANFQFQRVDIDAKRLEKVIQWLAGDAGTIQVPDDLTGALGSFSVYAALGDVRFNHASRVARVESIYVYVRDSYSFRDDDALQFQYLGHWNVDGVYLAPLPAVGQSGLGRWISAPLGRNHVPGLEQELSRLASQAHPGRRFHCLHPTQAYPSAPRSARESVMNIWRFLEQAFTWHFPSDEYVRWGWWMLSMPLLVVIALRAPFYIAREWESSKQRAIRSGILFVAVILGSDVAYYLQAACLRAMVSPQDCRVERPLFFGPYEALVCVTAGHVKDSDTEGFVRLRSTKDGSVLAEKEFYNPSFDEVFWTSNELIVGVGDGMAIIQIPPSWMDRLRAKLP